MSSNIATKLLKSCEKLFSEGIINESQYHLCKTSIGDGDSDSLKKIKISETKIFGENRIDKEAIYNKFIKEIDDTIKAIFQHMDNNPSNLISNGGYNPNNIYFGLLVNLDYFMNNLIDYVNSKSVSKYFQKESIHYEQLLSFYNDIDKNRKELKEVDKNFKTLDERNNIYLNKSDTTTKKAQINYVIFYLIIVLNIVGIIVYVKF
jgi:Ca2+-binding EF-hand superfamily protein